MMERQDDRYLEAARIVAECKPSKLPYVLAILREGGIEIEDNPLLPKAKNMKKPIKRAALKKARSIKDPVDWVDTDDQTILSVREAYKSGVSITRFASLACLPRTAVYKLINGQRPLTDYSRERLERGLAALREEELGQ